MQDGDCEQMTSFSTLRNSKETVWNMLYTLQVLMLNGLEVRD